MSDLWKNYTTGIKPLSVKTRPVRRKSLVPVSSEAKCQAEKRPLTLCDVPEGKGLCPDVHAPLERRREKAVRQGLLAIDAKLDLHGMTQAEAFNALAVFMQANVKAGARRLLIVTGKGRLGDGVLRAHLKEWLGRLPEAARVMALRHAAPRHGGAGAFYVLLRKN